MRGFKHGAWLGGKAAKDVPREYKAWRAMRQRCYQPNNISYRFYGAKGIGVHPSWRYSFAQFLADVGPCPGPGLQLDRIDGTRDYEPGNCRWVTPAENTFNRPSTIQLWLNGRLVGFKEYAEAHGMPGTALMARLRRGMLLMDAIVLPYPQPTGVPPRRPR